MTHNRLKGFGRAVAVTTAALIALATAPAAVAQDTNFSVLPPTFWVDQLPLQLLANDEARREREREAGAAPAAAAAPPAATTTTTYDASPAVTRRVRNQFIDFVAGTDGRANAEQLRTVFDQNDPVVVWSDVVREDGLAPGDAVDAVTAYWILNWIMANQADSDRAVTLAARRQMRAILAGNPTFARFDEAERQEISEVMILNFLVQHAGYSEALRTGDQVMMRRLGDAAVARFRNEMGVDLRRLRLTDQGFVPGA